jgi:hypothetical protein
LISPSDCLNGEKTVEAAMSRNKSTRWTEDQESLVLKLDAEGYPPRLIAAKLERSERSVVIRLVQLKKAAQHTRR